MNDGVRVTHDEWHYWAEYYGGLFPGATAEWIARMCDRMVRTLSFCGMPTRMSGIDYKCRLRNTLDALRALPDDSIRGGGDG